MTEESWMDVVAEADRWLGDDPDPDTRAELRALLDAGDTAALAERFGARLEFGTAGIRGPLGAGPARMNRAVVRRVTAGLAARLLLDGDAAGGVVVGHDARHKSAELAGDTARVLAGAGIRVLRLAGLSPTPFVPYAVRALGAAAGVQITASHNPATDNGYKVYWSDGAQIVPPLDAEISAAIDAVDDLSGVVVAPAGDPLIGDVPAGVVDGYRRSALAQLVRPEARCLRIVYTPMHGVAGETFTGLLADAGFEDVAVVSEQARPDPDFPTAAFPNPEVPGALDLALALAAERHADLVLANDPDGDRIAAAVPGHGGWVALNGDQLGCLVAEWLLEHAPGDGAVVATTVVSSQLLSRIAAAAGARYAETLTGFKWLARAALAAVEAGERFVVAYEQALGVMVGTAVMDKDGLSAGLVVAEMAAARKANGTSLLECWDGLQRRHGVHLTAGHSVRLDGPDGDALAAAALARLRADPPSTLGGAAVAAISDYTVGRRRHVDGTVEPLDLPQTDLVSVALVDGSRVQVRPSGTEPLLKFYVEAYEGVPDGDVAAAERRAATKRDRLLTEFLAAAGLSAAAP